MISTQALLSSLDRLAQQMAWLEEIAYREWNPSHKDSSTRTSQAAPSLSIDATSWDMLQACIQAVQDVWCESGHIYLDQWRVLVSDIHKDADYIAQCKRVDAWIQALDQLTTRAEKITKSQTDLDPKGVLVLTPTQLADYLATQYQISCSAENARNLIRRHHIKATRLGDGYYVISTTSIQALAAKHKPADL